MADEFDLSEMSEKPDTSIRGSIKAAIEDARIPDGDDEKPRTAGRVADIDGDVEEKETRKARKEPSEQQEKAPKERRTDGKFAPKEEGEQPDKKVSRQPKESADDTVSAPQPTEAKSKPPVGWTREGKAGWDSLTPDIQKSVLKREEEFSSGIKQYADKAKSYDELDQVITPYKQQIQAFGVTPAQTIGKLLEWMQGLGNPNQQYKHLAFQTLAQSFGYDLNNLAPRQPNAENDEESTVRQPAYDPSVIDQLVQQRMQPIQQQFQSFQQQQEQASREQARNAIAEWSKDKPHYEQVRTTMHNLISSGEVPLKNGTLDLDGAYNKAIRLNEDVWTQIQEESQQKSIQEAQERAAKEASEKAAKLRKAQNVGIGIRPTAPMIRPGAMPAKPNGDARKATVRDSLRLSMQQLRDGE